MEKQLENQRVQHITFGPGQITQVDSAKKIITVQFSDKAREFVIPYAFGKFLTAEDSHLQEALLREISILEAEKAAKAPKETPPSTPVVKEEAAASKADEKGKAEQTDATNKEAETAKPVKAKRIRQRTRRNNQEKNIIFKLNFCDGGAEEAQLGYKGVCSEENIRYNHKMKRYWCSYAGSPCGQYMQGVHNYETLCGMMNNGGYVCYESQLFRDWTMGMGDDLTPPNPRPRKLPSFVRTNSLAVLSTQLPDTEGRDRIVIGVFLVQDLVEATETQSAYVTAHPKYRLALSPAEASQVLLWTYFANENRPAEALWGSGLYRKFDSQGCAAILHKIAALKEGTPEEETAQSFYQHFCQLNGIDPQHPPIAAGALTL